MKQTKPPSLAAQSKNLSYYFPLKQTDDDLGKDTKNIGMKKMTFTLQISILYAFVPRNCMLSTLNFVQILHRKKFGRMCSKYGISLSRMITGVLIVLLSMIMFYIYFTINIVYGRRN